MSDLLTISLEDWLRWRQKMELLSYDNGSIPLQDAVKYLDELDQQFTRTASRKSSASASKMHRSSPGSTPPVPPSTKDASTQLYTIREGFFSKYVLKNIANKLSVQKLAREVGRLGNLVAALSKDLVTVLALWLSGSSYVLEHSPMEHLAMNRSERSSSPIASLPELQAETYLESPENLVHLLRPETSTSLFAFLPTRLRREYSAGQSRTSLNPCERMARVLATWGEGRLKTEGNLLSSPVLRNGWVCRVCRQDARRLYSYDNASRRLNRVEEALGSDTSRPSSNPNGFAHGSKIQCSSVMSRESRSPTPRNNNVNNNSSSKRWQPMDRLGVGRGLKAPQRPAFLCAGFSKALASTGPNSRMLNDSFAPESFQDTFMTTKGLSKR